MDTSRKNPDVLLVSFDYQPWKFADDIPILIIGRKTEGEIADIVNAFQGDDALDLYERLITKKGE